MDGILLIQSGWFRDHLVPTLIATAAVAFFFATIGYIYRNKIKARIWNRYYLLRNRPIIASAKSVYTYPVPESGPIEIGFDREVCDEIANATEDAVTEPDWGSKWATFNVENIPTKVKVRFEPQIDPSFHNPAEEAMGVEENISGYKLVVETTDDLYFGYKYMFPLLNFRTFSEKVANVIEAEYLPTETANTSHIQVELKSGVPEGIDRIHDDKLNIRGRVRNGKLNLTFRTPEHLDRGVRKYIQSTN